MVVIQHHLAQGLHSGLSVPRIFKLLRDRTGTNLLEAAIITPLLLIITFAICDFASLFYAYLAIENGASIATRFAVTGNTVEDPQNPGTQLSRIESVKRALRDATPTLTIQDGDISFSHLPKGSQNWVPGVGGPDEIEKISINYTWDIMTPLIRPFFTGGQIHVQVDSTMKNEARFQ